MSFLTTLPGSERQRTAAVWSRALTSVSILHQAHLQRAFCESFGVFSLNCTDCVDPIEKALAFTLRSSESRMQESRDKEHLFIVDIDSRRSDYRVNPYI